VLPIQPFQLNLATSETAMFDTDRHAWPTGKLDGASQLME
jgi:hypothetical protein